MRNDHGAKARFETHAARPPVHIGLAALTVAGEGLLVFLFVAVGLTLRRLDERGDQALERALPWLKRAAPAAFFWAVAQPLADSCLNRGRSRFLSAVLKAVVRTTNR